MNTVKSFWLTTGLCSSMLFGYTADLSAQNVAPQTFVSTVNGAPISSELLDRAVAVRAAQSRQAPEVLRARVLEELIVREVLAQEATRLALEKLPATQQRLDDAKKNILAETLLNEFSAKNAVTDAELRAQYDLEIQALGDTSAVKKYRLKLIAVDTEAEGMQVIALLRKGGRFDQLAAERSKHASSANGGQLGWLRLSQMVPAVATEVEKVVNSGLIQKPIQARAGWNVIRVDEVQPFEPETFDQARDRIRRNLINLKLNEFVRDLRSKAKVTQ